MIELIEKQAEIINALVSINKETLTLLAQFMEVTKYEENIDELYGAYIATIRHAYGRELE